MTSNVGSDVIKQLGAQAESMDVRNAVMSALDRQFRPEFLNRLDDIITFHSLTRDHIVRIVDIQLVRLEKLLAQRRVTVELTMNAKMFLADHGFDPVFGARPLKRAVQKYLQDPLASSLLESTIHEGDHIVVDATNDELFFTPVDTLVDA